MYCRDAHFCRQQEQTCGQRQSSYTPNSTTVQLHTKLYGSPATHQTLRQSSYTPNSTAVQLHTKTLRQSSYTPNSMTVELHTKLYDSRATHQTLRQSSYTPNSTAVRLHTKLYDSRATHQTLQQQGGTGEDGYIHLADRTLSVAAIEKKKKMVSVDVTDHVYLGSARVKVVEPQCINFHHHSSGAV